MKLQGGVRTKKHQRKVRGEVPRGQAAGPHRRLLQPPRSARTAPWDRSSASLPPHLPPQVAHKQRMLEREGEAAGAADAAPVEVEMKQHKQRTKKPKKAKPTAMEL